MTTNPSLHRKKVPSHLSNYGQGAVVHQAEDREVSLCGGGGQRVHILHAELQVHQVARIRYISTIIGVFQLYHELYI